LNVLNIVNFGLPSNTVLGPGFRCISRTAGSSRQIQFSLKLIYWRGARRRVRKNRIATIGRT
jgi:hypothetical protein